MVKLIELTVPHEDNMDAVRAQKIDRYMNLLDDFEDAGWKAIHFPIEVGCRGFVNNKVRSFLLSLGFSHHSANSVIRDIQSTVEKASHWVWLKRYDENWLE